MMQMLSKECNTALYISSKQLNTYSRKPKFLVLSCAPVLCYEVNKRWMKEERVPWSKSSDLHLTADFRFFLTKRLNQAPPTIILVDFQNRNNLSNNKVLLAASTAHNLYAPKSGSKGFFSARTSNGRNHGSLERSQRKWR